MARKISEYCLNMIKQWEGSRLMAYRDISGIWTIGYGHTAAAGEPYPKDGDKITEQQASDILLKDLEQYESAVEQTISVPLDDNQFGALVSFCYNVGIGAFERSTLIKKLNKGKYTEVPNELMKWVKSGGKTVNGLVNRRAAEAGLWSKGSYVSSNFTKPKADKTKQLLSPEIITSSVGALSGAGSVISGSTPLQWALAAIVILCGVVAAIYFFHRMKA